MREENIPGGVPNILCFRKWSSIINWGLSDRAVPNFKWIWNSFIWDSSAKRILMQVINGDSEGLAIALLCRTVYMIGRPMGACLVDFIWCGWVTNWLICESWKNDKKWSLGAFLKNSNGSESFKNVNFEDSPDRMLIWGASRMQSEWLDGILVCSCHAFIFQILSLSMLLCLHVWLSF